MINDDYKIYFPMQTEGKKTQKKKKKGCKLNEVVLVFYMLPVQCHLVSESLTFKTEI